MTDDIQIKQLPAQLVLVVTMRTKMTEMGAAMGEAFHELGAHLAATGATVVGPPLAMYPEEVKDETTFQVGMPVAPGAVAGDGVDVQELPAGEAATLLYRGPYEAMGPSWRRLMEWVTDGRQFAGPPREVYLSEPGTVAPDDTLTELIAPLV